MIKLIIGIFVCISTILCVTGCNIFKASTAIPTLEQISTVSYNIGSTTALVANMINIDDESRKIVYEILTNVQSHVPNAGESFEDAWTSISEQHLSKLVETNKISQAKSIIIGKVIKIVYKGIDYIVDKRYPLARQRIDLIHASINNFCTAFLSRFNVNTEMTFSSTQEIIVDEEAFEYLKTYYFSTINN